jgi:hypothetical protein
MSKNIIFVIRVCLYIYVPFEIRTCGHCYPLSGEMYSNRHFCGKLGVILEDLRYLRSFFGHRTLLELKEIYCNVDDQNVSRQRPVNNLQSRKCTRQ